jgi:hypothetical protein
MKYTILALLPSVVAGADGPRQHAAFSSKVHPNQRSVFVVKAADGSADVLVSDSDLKSHTQTYRWGRLPSYQEFAGKLTALRVLQLPNANHSLDALCGGKTSLDVRIGNKTVRYISDGPAGTVTRRDQERYKAVAQFMLQTAETAKIPITSERYETMVWETTPRSAAR